MDEVACDTYIGEGGGGRGGRRMSMDDASTDLSGLIIQGRPRSLGELLNGVAFGDACDGD